MLTVRQLKNFSIRQLSSIIGQLAETVQVSDTTMLKMGCMPVQKSKMKDGQLLSHKEKIRRVVMRMNIAV
jgi:hypothetical protein